MEKLSLGTLDKSQKNRPYNSEYFTGLLPSPHEYWVTTVEKWTTVAAQIAQLELGTGNATGWKKRNEYLKTIFIYHLLPSNVIHSCSAKTLVIKGKQEKRALLHTWQRRALLRCLGAQPVKQEKKTLKMLLRINKYIHTCIHFLKVLTP